VTVRWLEVPPSCKSHCLCSLMLGCVYLHARYLIVLKLVCVGALLCPSSPPACRICVLYDSCQSYYAIGKIFSCCLNLAHGAGQNCKS